MPISADNLMHGSRIPWTRWSPNAQLSPNALDVLMGWKMGWLEPSDSKNAVRRAGQRFRDGEQTLDDFGVLNRWRAAHGYIINTFQASLRNRTRGRHIPVAQRLKRATTIIDKLRQGRALDLATMHDIAGVRLVFPDVDALIEFRVSMHQTRAKHALVNEIDKYQYIQSPKASGYRGVHDVYRYKAGTKNGARWNGLLIEIQYRTVVQHAWATAVELSDALTANRTKFSQGSAESTRFFQISSELLARQFEASTSCLPDESRADLIEEWKSIEDRCHFFQQLRNVWQGEKQGLIRGFVLLVIPSDGNLQVENQRSYRQAISRLLELEAKHPDWDIVLVSGEDESLRSAFRNYFGNATEFVAMMEEVTGS